MSLYKELSYDNEFEHIRGIQFSIMSPDDITKNSVVEITKSETFNGNEPVFNGLFDPRMGVIDHNKTCITCGQKNTFCPGHFGHIKLVKPIFYVQFFDTVKKLLNCVCFRCSKLLVDPNSAEVKAIESKKMSRQKRWDAMYKLCAKVKRCGQVNPHGCGARKPVITKDGMLKIGFEWKEVKEKSGDAKAAFPPDARKQTLNAEDVLQILRRISDKDAELLGYHPKYNRPEWMICTVVPVPPPAVRPSVRSETGQRQEDDITHKLLDIIKYNKMLGQKLEKAGNDKASEDNINMIMMLLQYAAATMIDNTNPSIPKAEQKTGRPIRSLTERLKSKDGRIRGNLMGKRVDFSARSVITPDPNISINELGVPLKIAMNMTFPEVVTKWNMDEMYKLVRNGPDVYPGAKHVKFHKDGTTRRLKNIDRSSIILSEGDIVERHMRNGDYVLFNRQPSLHRMSMMGHRARIMPYNTFRLNVMATPSYNADFDGDEMNMHLPQSYQTMEELRQLAAVPTQIISPRECQPIISIVQDICLGVYRITKSYTRIPERNFYNLLMTNQNFRGDVPAPKDVKGKAKYWSGHQALSAFMPERLNLDIKTYQYDENLSDEQNKEHIVKIKNGQILSGCFDKSIYQARTKGVIHSVFSEYGSDETRRLFDHTQKLICDWLVYSGFSVGGSDLVVESSTLDKFKKTIHNMKVETYDVMKSIHEGRFENNSTHNNNIMFERKVIDILNNANKTVGDAGLKNIRDENNRLINMIKSKSKGNTINVAQMIGCVGQQNVDGKRIPYGFEERTLPHYTKYDDGPESRGFVENSFIKGLTPQEFFFHAMGGREGLIDTAVQSVTGDTPIIIIEDGKGKYVNIGDWIDGHLDSNKEGVKIFTQQHNMEYLKFPKSKKVLIQTCDEKGIVTWADMSAITRHDPSSEIYEITTQSQRKVKVVDSKSLIVWDKKKKEFIEKNTSEVNVGDFIPMSRETPEPPIIHEYLEMSDYFPKTKYLYGTDLHVAIDMMREAMLNESKHGKIRAGWWEDHNGKEFTTPFPSKARLQRFTVRSDNESIKDEMVYNFKGTRGQAGIPARFKLDRDFGRFIGYYLADGVTDHHSGTVMISTINPGLQKFVQDWCSKYDIQTVVRERQMKIGKTASVYCHSSLLCQFLDVLVGRKAHLKYIPDIAYTAPKEFAQGLIEGYWSGDGSVKKGRIVAGSTSEKLINGVAHLLSRFGIPTYIRRYHQKENNLGTKNIKPMYYLNVKGDDRKTFAHSFTLIKPDKQEDLQGMLTSMLDQRISTQTSNDVVLDKITSIKKLVDSEYTKVYDVTVESTLNFAIGNSLYIRDTSEVGYTQRKLVKAMEDCKVNYDYSVRNASGVIIQFLYGEDGIESCKLENQQIPTITMDPAKIVAVYGGKKQDFKGFIGTDLYNSLPEDTLNTQMQQHLDQLMADREHLIVKVFKGKDENTLLYPVAFYRMINTITNLYEGSIEVSYDLSPLHVLDTIDTLCKELTVSRSHPGNRLLQCLLRVNLSPKKVICQYHLTKMAFDALVAQIRFRFEESLASPSEMVGVIAAQSIGEPATQLVLNSFHMSGTAVAAQATRGVPRLNELLSVSKNIKTPIMHIYLHESIRSDKKQAMKYMNNIRTIRFRDIVSKVQLFYDPNDFNTGIPEDAGFIESYRRFMRTSDLQSHANAHPWLLRMEMDKGKMLEYNVDMITLHHVLTNFYDENIHCMFSDDNADKLIMRIKLTDKDIKSDDILTDMKALEHNILENVIVKGIKSIERVAPDEKKYKQYNSQTKNFDDTKEWVIYTSGTNLREVLIKPHVDSIRTVTNDVNEVYEVLGIEAARNSLYNEIKDVLDGGMVTVNYRHLALLVDVMTNRGNILSVNRHGINRGDIGPLAKCSFEETTDKLIKAGIFAEHDKINGVSANVMLGQIAPCGTGDVTINMDEEMLAKMTATSQLATINEDDEGTGTCDITTFKTTLPPVARDNTIAKKEANDFEIV
jgi:DNA-directed RNA polymerase beta' subunit/intein/homing endonuclease